MTEKEVKQILSETREKGTSGEIEEYKTGNYGCDWYHKNVL